ncbi:hypothetical protein BS47DRAFT_1373986 [Hydnum rufescens UP504]|uniref:sphinganine-1-phosphate aldolase n=1 Tax=Hydnum rufescens UP504 TaxID=1448309 RepID=A0A9P6DQ77_9AGAM|nr:hypothetical protein BS47DRAFT_1373986 [Hydnum rufescens UP504]
MSKIIAARVPIGLIHFLRGWATYNHLKSAVTFYVLASYLLQSYRHLLSRGVRASVRDTWLMLSRFIINLVLLDIEMGKAQTQIEDKLIPSGPDVVRHLALPSSGHDLQWILSEMDAMDSELGRLSGAVYHGGEELQKVIVTAMEKYIVSNPLHPDVFPAIRKMDAEIVAMCLRMYNHPNGAGTTTSGGTESILMSVKTHRDWARATKHIIAPEMVIPATAHAAFFKAAAYFNIKIHCIPVDSTTRQVDLRRVRRAINGNTIMLVGSATNFPDGCQDDIVALGVLAKSHNIGLHVDCCLGSFIMPFLEEAGFPVEPFDFRVEGVTAISCDTHKGSSVIMYRSATLRGYQYYIQPDWAGGVYASPSISGSRPGAILAGTWAAMQFMGHEGYLESCRSIVSCAKTIQRTIREEIPELYILGNPPASTFAFGSKTLNVLEVGDAMSRRGWHLNALGDATGVHLACTRLTIPNIHQFIADLKDSVSDAKIKPQGEGSMVAIYGLGSSSAAGPDMVGKVARMFIDAMYKA